MRPQIFLDCDGVLADFDGYYETCFGQRPNQDSYEPPDLWDNVRKHGSFYRNLPLMPDAMELWDGVKKFHSNPIILTGIPHSIRNVKEQKTAWVEEHFDCPVICCFSKDKCKFGEVYDILVDDRLKYAHFWKDMGGIFIHHTSARNSLAALANHYRLA